MTRIIFEYGDIDVIYIFYKNYVAVEHIQHTTGKIVSSYTTRDRDGVISHITNDAWDMEEKTSKGAWI